MKVKILREHNEQGEYEYDDRKLSSYAPLLPRKVLPKPPEPYGAPSPNFICEETEETLFVTKYEVFKEESCFTVFRVECSQAYDQGKVGDS